MTYWIVALFLVYLAVCNVGVYGGRKHGHHGHSKSKSFMCNVFSPTNNDAAAQYGVKIPPKSCLLTWREFEKYVVGQDWLGIFVLDDDNDVLTAHKAKLIWEKTINGNIRRLATLRSDQGERECILADSVFTRACPKFAKLRPVDDGGEFITDARMDRFMSCDPTKWVIFCICYVEEVKGRCPSTECFLLVKDQRPLLQFSSDIATSTSTIDIDEYAREGDLLLDGIPWGKIECKFKHCLDHVFDDTTHPRLEWVWHMDECPHPKSDEAAAL